MAHVVHLRIRTAGEFSPATYAVEATFIKGNTVVEKTLEIEVPLGLTDPDGPPALWHSLWSLVADDIRDGDDLGVVVLRLHEPELRALDWERLARNGETDDGSGSPVVLRTAVGPGSFHRGERLSFGDLPVRVLVVGVDSHVGRGAASDPPWHEDVAVHAAVHARAERWEVDVLPEPVSHSVLSTALKVSKPHVLHLAGSTARRLFEEASSAPDVLNLSSVRLVVSSCHEPPDEARRLLEPFVQADALHPVLAAVSLTSGPEPDPDHDLCESLTTLYGELIAGSSLDAAVRSVTDADPAMSAAVTVNCLPERVLPKPSQPLPPSAFDLYEPLERATDRVGQRRTALEQLESGAGVKRLIVLSGGEQDARMGATWFLLSTVRAWEERPGRRALYLDFERRRSTNPLRPAERPPQGGDIVLETVALLTSSLRTHSERHGGWDIDDDLTALEEQIARESLNVLQDGGYRTENSAVRHPLVGAAVELLVKAARPNTHLVLALDHFVENNEVSSAAAHYLVNELFNPVLHSRSAVTVVATAKNLHDRQTADRLAGFVAERHHITLQRWSAHHGGPLLRELGTRLGYDWHGMPEWRELVREKLDSIAEDFGPQFLEEVYDAALTRIG
ncbi:hypothetical protein GR925_19325 [Streptomyces sp. HUCO-GS316]|uniref:hypothetical protein n=1 Tax=Streptomyces sp. HUCO-GS316 TaxID=2692198 RepID=UPI00136D571E|nr:hypothetical protein [Streptomyces sp. HUCO-GS316]MXM65545.1 hypothetical protein [Streptomyces sp. HUCO-GS316]